MDHPMLNAFVGSSIFLLVASLGFLVKSWMGDVKDSNGKLVQAIEKLTNLIADIERSQALHSFRIQKLEGDIHNLQTGKINARQPEDVCVQPEGCPLGKAFQASRNTPKVSPV